LANLANFAYDPVNYEYMRTLNVIDLFLGNHSNTYISSLNVIDRFLGKHSVTRTTSLNVIDLFLGNHSNTYNFPECY
jgi:hypothetical protein